MLRLGTLPLPISLDLELATHRLNHRSLRSLGRRTPCQVYHAGRLTRIGAKG